MDPLGQVVVASRMLHASSVQCLHLDDLFSSVAVKGFRLSTSTRSQANSSPVAVQVVCVAVFFQGHLWCPGSTFALNMFLTSYGPLK